MEKNKHQINQMSDLGPKGYPHDYGNLHLFLTLQ